MSREAKDLRRILFRDGFNYFLSKVIPGLMGFLSVLIFVRLLGVEQYGRYAMIFALVMAWASGLSGWLSQGVLRFQSQWHHPDDSENFFRSTMLGMLLSAIAGFVFLGIAMPALGIEKGWSLFVPLALLCGLIAYTVAIGRLQASLQSRKVLWLEISRAVLCLLIPVSFVALAGLRDYRLLLFGIAAGYSLPLASWFLFRQRPRSKNAGELFGKPSVESRRVLSEVWQFGWPVAVWLLCQQGLLVSDRYFLQRFFGYADAGVYASMYDVIVRSFSLLFMPVTLAIHPLVMNFWNSGKRAEALRAIYTGVLYQLLLFVPIAAGLFFLSPLMTRMVLGRQSPVASALALPLTVGGFLWQVCLLSHKPLELLCQTKRMLVGISLALAINIGGNWLLVPRYGYRASAYLTIASATAYLLMLLILTPLEDLRRSAALGTAAPEPIHCNSAEPVTTSPS